METKFGQIFDFQYRQAKKLENSSCLEDLTGLLAKVASRINENKDYYFERGFYLENYDEEPNTSFEQFVKNFKNTISNGFSETVNIIRGRAGIGKSS